MLNLPASGKTVNISTDATLMKDLYCSINNRNDCSVEFGATMQEAGCVSSTIRKSVFSRIRKG